MAYTKEDIIRMVKEEDIEFIRMQFTDIFGQLKNVAITASQVGKAVNNEILRDLFGSMNRTNISIRIWILLPSFLGGPSTARWPGSSAMCIIRMELPLWAILGVC